MRRLVLEACPSEGVREAIAAGVVIVSALVIGFASINASRNNGVVPFFYQSYYEPAVRMACGQSFAIERAGCDVTWVGNLIGCTIDRSGDHLSSEMVAFLKQERETLTCDAVRPATDPYGSPPARIWYHKLVATAAVWKLTGISWPAVDGIAATMLALATVCVYGMFRFWTPIPVAATLAILSALPALGFLIFLRDLSKAPFILASLLVAALLVSRNLSRWQFFAVMVATGFWLGIGYGFRPDVLIGLPLLAATAIAFRLKPATDAWWHGVVGTSLLFVAFLVAASPIFPVFGTNVGTCQWHFALLGLSDVHTGILGMKPGSVSWLSHYDDLLVWKSVESYADRALALPGVGYCTPMYDKASKALYFDILSTFPGDFLDRAMAAARQVVAYGWSGLSDVKWPKWLAALATELRATIRNVWIWVWMALVFAILVRSVRLGLFTCFMVAYLCAYPIVQFDTRHYFHLAFLAWVPVGLACTALVRGSSGGDSANQASRAIAWWTRLEMPTRSAWLRAILIMAGIVTAMAALYFGAHTYQRGMEADLFARYLKASGEPPVVMHVHEMDGTLQITYQGFPRTEGRRVTGRMLRLDVGAAGCAPGTHRLTLAVTGPAPGQQQKKEFVFSTAPQRPTAVIFSPIFLEASDLINVGIAIPLEDKACLARVNWLDSKALPPLWVGATLYNND